MKKTRKILALVMAFVMVMAMASTAMAANVTVDTGLNNHTFTVYQIFSGREDDGILSDIQWGGGIDHDAFLTALQNDGTIGSDFSTCGTAADVAKVLETYATDSDKAKLVAKIAYAKKTSGDSLSENSNNLADGYYLVVDTTASVGNGDAYNAALLQLVGEVNIGLKTDAPQMEKKVKEDDKYNEDGGYGLGYNDVADYDMSEPVSFHLIANVPDMTYYDTYKYVFHDNMSDGLKLDKTSFKVYLSDDKKFDTADTLIVQDGNYTIVYSSTDDDDFTLSFADLKAVEGVATSKYIIVEYTATLTTDAVVGLDGNPNTAYLEYSNKPDHSGSGDNQTGNTPEDKVIVFTYELDVTKIDGKVEEGKDPTKLAGAEFVLYKVVDNVNKYAVLDANGKVTGWAAATVDENGKDVYPANSTLTSALNTGLFQVTGLDDGTYYLKETKAPASYNLLENPITVVISATTANGQDWEAPFTPDAALTALAVTADGKAGSADAATGAAAITIANNKGAQLPETGGIGTTIFYAVGGVLVLAAIVLLVSKKRMASEE